MSLAGRGVVVTRPRAMAEGLASLLEREGARAIRFPAIEIEPLPRPAALSRPADYDLAVFVSPTAVAQAMDRADGWPRLAAVGAGTRRELEKRGARAVIAPREEADSEALLALPELAAVAGRRVLIVRGEGGRALLGDALRKRGARVDYAECYRRRAPRADPASLLSAWERNEVHAVTIGSGEALDNLLGLLGDKGAARLLATPLFVAHERIAASAARAGARRVSVAGPGDEEMLRALVAYFAA